MQIPLVPHTPVAWLPVQWPFLTALTPKTKRAMETTAFIFIMDVWYVIEGTRREEQ
jgi:hypothetical protein